MSRAVARLRLVVPAAPAGVRRGDRAAANAGRVSAAVDILSQGLADALAGVGVTTRIQLHGSAADGSPRADVALWFPNADGTTPAPDLRAAPARVHVAVVVDPRASRHFHRYDALLVPTPARSPVVAATHQAVHALQQSGKRAPTVVAARLAGVAPPREAERRARHLDGALVVVDVRRGSGANDERERALMQLSLRGDGSTVVLTADDDDVALDRLRALAERQALPAFLTAGDDGVASALTVADVAVVAARWDELLLAGLCRTALVQQPGAAGPLVESARTEGAVEELHGVLQLAATIDRRLKDPGTLRARGLALHDVFFQPAQSLYDQLVAIQPLPGTLASTLSWEAIGPRPTTTHDVVKAVDPQSTPPTSAAQKIEDDLAALKARLHREQAPGSGDAS